MKYWSTAFFQYSITPVLHYSNRKELYEQVCP
jgi:hypothetical protein